MKPIESSASKCLAMNPFKGAGSLVLRRLLADPEREWTGIELAQELDLSNPWCNKVLNTLESEKIVERGGRGLAAFTRLVDPKELLAQWSTVYRFPKNTFHGFITKEKDALQSLVEACDKEGWLYGLTGRSALRRKFKAKVQGPEAIYISPKARGYTAYREMLKTLERKYGFYRVQANPDVQVINPVLGRSVYYERETHRGLKVVSPLQLWLDLKGMNPEEPIPEKYLNSLSNAFLR
jgi:DNA-binding Lrp family transcriptional regulator